MEVLPDKLKKKPCMRKDILKEHKVWKEAVSCHRGNCKTLVLKMATLLLSGGSTVPGWCGSGTQTANTSSGETLTLGPGTVTAVQVLNDTVLI